MKNHSLLLSVLLCSFLFLSPVSAEPKYEEDLHYFTIIPSQPGGEGERVQVLEFFWYACPHCYQLEPHLDAWLARKPENVDFDRVPAMFSRSDVVLHAKTYYALRLMGLAEELNETIFKAIHEKNQKLRTQGEMEALLAEHGVDIVAFGKAMKSFAVQTQARRAAVLAERFDVRGVPAIVVDGKYRTSGLGGVLTMTVTDYLIDRVRKEKAAGEYK
ncbi:MAG: thiol:disulfide interchange protein DsbA/DsbL [Gammaproteobacteria bacterium]|nr:thiol:disulfide interchange protein DsbA/DsbL [Gammaproteobacteria bacterium]